jgi:hypothetical protein
MASTLHIAIRDAVAALFTANTALAGGRVYSNREFVLVQGVESGIWVNRRTSNPVRITTPVIDWDTEINVQIRTRKGASGSAEAIADDLSASVYGRLMSASNLGGLAIDVVPGPIDWSQDEADTNVCVCDMTFTVQHRTTYQAISA